VERHLQRRPAGWTNQDRPALGLKAQKSRQRLTFAAESSYKPPTFSSGGLARMQPLAQIVFPKRSCRRDDGKLQEGPHTAVLK